MWTETSLHNDDLKQNVLLKESTDSTTTTISSLTSSSSNTPRVALRNLVFLEDWNSVLSACRSNPHEATIPDRMGDLPLHEACQLGSPFHIIESLLSAYPDGIKSRGFCGRLPLHSAVYKQPSLIVIKYLLQKYPKAAATIDADGRLPIHLAVVRNSPKQVIEILIGAYPKSLQTPNIFGNTPQMLTRSDYIYSVLQEKGGEKDKKENSPFKQMYSFVQDGKENEKTINPSIQALRHIDIKNKLKRIWTAQREKKIKGIENVDEVYNIHPKNPRKVYVPKNKKMNKEMNEREKKRDKTRRNTKYMPIMMTSV